MSDPVGYGLIGAGDRPEYIMEHLKERTDEVLLRGIFDPNQQRAEAFKAKFGSSETACYDDYRKLLADPQISWVLVTSPNKFHKEHIVAAFEAGKHVFGEKPLATTIDDCVAINQAHQASSGKLFATGFVLRYASLYRKAKELLADGAIGKIVAIDATENIAAAHGGHIMTNWRRFGDMSGSHMLEKCCHDIDLMNWLIGSLPSRVASFGGLNIFTPDNADLLHKFKAPPGKSSIYLEWDIASRDSQDPFNSEKSIVDNQVAILEYRNGVRANFQTVMNNAIPERRMYIAGTEGTLIAELYEGRLEMKRLGYGEERQSIDVSGASMHGGGDKHLTDALVESMVKAAEPACSGREGLTSAVVSLAIEQARLDGSVVDLEPTWQRLGQGLTES